MITRSTKYNPAFHSNIPANIRFAWNRVCNRSLEPLSDEELFELHKESYDMSSDPDDDAENLNDLIHEALDNKERS